MVRIKLSHIFVIAAVPLLVVLPAAAQSFTQLDFDRPPEILTPPPEPDPELVNQLIEAQPEANTANPPEPAKAANKSSENVRPRPEARAALKKPDPIPATSAKISSNDGLKIINEQKIDWEKPQDGRGFLVPRLKGPFTDANSTTTITTAATWTKNLGSCGDINDIQQLCNKARALKELLKRFSGNDDFFESQCSYQCSDSAYTSVLSGFAVGRVPNGEFLIPEAAGECRYQLRLRSESASWQVIRGERGTCSCLPKSCL